MINGNEVTFYYESSTATKVEVFGSMNEWASGLEMTKEGNVFSYTCELDAGIYQYKFVVDGSEWIMDPANENQMDDGAGNFNSSFEVTASAATPENTTTEDASTEDNNDTQASDADKDDATPSGLPSGAIIAIVAIVTILVVLGAFAGYMFYIKKKKA